jgi:hypothetical protein
LTSGRTVFFAYAATPPELGEMIESACETANKFKNGIEYVTWKQNDIIGLDLIEPIRENIEASEYFIADISSFNYNVVYEIGYAIGLGKRAVLVKNIKSPVSLDELNRVGIFDTLGYVQYVSSMDLATKITTIPSTRVIATNFEKNFTQPLYLVACAAPNETSQRISSRLKKTKLQFRSFMPTEDIRLSANSAVENISSSLGVVLDWRKESDDTSKRHNLRTAFCAGLAHALKIETVIFCPPQSPIPLDFRNSTVPVSRLEDIDEGIAGFVPGVNEAFQQGRRPPIRKTSRLSDISLGDPAAENELGDINRYFLRSATYAAATKGNVRTIVGRKGSGKTALWARIRSYLTGVGKIVIVDLKPEGYQLVRLREEVLEHLTFGQKLHLATAFWEYLLLLEIATKIIDGDKKMHTRNPRLTEGYQELAELVSDYNDLGDTDFSERLHNLSVDLAENLSSDRDFMTGKFNGAELTNKIYSIDIKKIRQALFAYLREKDGVWILFDNLDRGWPVHGLEEVDFVILRSLIDAARKLERSFAKENVSFHSLVFIRDDIYSELVARTSDFGKEQPQRIDWRDGDQLRELIRLRLADNEEFANDNFKDAWSKVFCSHYKGVETSQYLIERSMMRPRNLLNLINHCRSVAINMQHQIIEENDIEKGADAFSTDLLVELSREMEDVIPEHAKILWDFVRSPQQMNRDQLLQTLAGASVEAHENDRIMERLMYYGFIGIVIDGEDLFIYDFNYEINLMLANIRKLAASVIFSIHPAFRDSLSLK